MADSYERYQRALERSLATRQQAIDRRRAQEQVNAKARQEAAIRAQEIAAQARRDKQQHLYDMQSTAQRGNIAYGAREQDFGYSKKLDQQQQKALLKRDTLQNQFMTERERQEALDLERRDARQFGYATQENEQQFGQQMERDAVQQGYSTQRDQLQQKHTLQRDFMQSGIQADRDQRLNMFDTQRDEMQQQFTRQNMYQREAADISARWQDQIQQARSSGLDFSAKQKKEMQDLDEAFRKNVLNSNLDEGLKQQAMVEHQKKLSAIVPNERVQKPEDGLNQSLIFHEPTNSWYMMRQDANGPPTYEPLGGPGQDPMMKAQQQAAEKKAQAQTKAEFDRQDRWDKVLEKHMTKEDAEGNPFYKSDEEILAAAMKEFASTEKLFRDNYDLKPLPPYQNEADAVRAKLMKQMESQPSSSPSRSQMLQGNQQVPVNQPVQQPPAQSQPAQGMGDSARLRSGDVAPAPRPVILSTKPLSKDVTDQIRDIAGGKDLSRLWDKHKSNSFDDQMIRMATKIMIESMLTGDTSDPHFAEAQKILTKAGIKLGP